MAVHALEAACRLAPRFAARAAMHGRDGSFPLDDFADLREAGLFGPMVLRALSGAGDVCAGRLGIAASGGDPDRDGATPRW